MQQPANQNAYGTIDDVLEIKFAERQRKTDIDIYEIGMKSIEEMGT